MKVNRITHNQREVPKGPRLAWEEMTPRQRSRRVHQEKACARNQETRRDYNKDGCVRCGYANLECLENHHIFEVDGEKNRSVAELAQTPTADRTFKLELAKTIPLCPNCHVEHHMGQWDLTEELYARIVLSYARLRRSA